MATAPKAAPKAGAKSGTAPEAVAEAPPKKSKGKLMLLIGAVLVVLLGVVGAVVWHMKSGDAEGGKGKVAEKIEPGKPPVFVVLEPFTVNLLSDSGSEQVLQIMLTLQVPDEAQQDVIKSFMPQVRSRLLLLLSSKKASEILTVDGKKKLADDIMATVNQPFSSKGPVQGVNNVFITSFIIAAQ